MTIIGAVSPPAGDFSEPVTLHTKRYVRCFWALDRQRAQARFYPAIHPLLSYSADADALAEWWKHSGNPDWVVQRQRVLSLLETAGPPRAHGAHRRPRRPARAAAGSSCSAPT